MPIDPLFGFDAKSEIGRSPVPQPSPGPMPTSYSSTSPKEKIKKLYSLFPNKFGNYVVFDKPFVEHTGRVNFVTQDHRKLFFSRLYKHNKDVCIKYLKEYNEHDNYFYINNVENSKQEKDFIVDLYHETLIKTIPQKFIQFIYLNEKFSDWPLSEQRRFLIFIKTVGGKDALKEFDKSIVQDVENRERGFREWLGDQKIVPKWLDKYGNPDMIAKINFIEKLFSKLDNIVIPKIIAMPHDPSHPEKDPRYTLLCEYAYFIVARNAINPISWYVGLCSITKLSEEWDKIVYLCKSGSPEEFALFLGQIIGTLLSIPLGIKIGSLAKTKMPIAVATVKALIKKATKGKIDPAKIDKVLNRAIFSKKPASRSRTLTPEQIKIINLRKNIIKRFNNAKTIKGKLKIAQGAFKEGQFKLAAKLYSRVLDSALKEVEKTGKCRVEIEIIESHVLVIRAASRQYHYDAILKKYANDLGNKIIELYRKQKPADVKPYFARLKLKAQKLEKKNTFRKMLEKLFKKTKIEKEITLEDKLKEMFKKAKKTEDKMEIADMAYKILKEDELAADFYEKILLDIIPKQTYVRIGEVYSRLWNLAREVKAKFWEVKANFGKDSALTKTIEKSLETIEKSLVDVDNAIWRIQSDYFRGVIIDHIKLMYNIDVIKWY